MRIAAEVAFFPLFKNRNWIFHHLKKKELPLFCSEIIQQEQFQRLLILYKTQLLAEVPTPQKYQCT